MIIFISYCLKNTVHGQNQCLKLLVAQMVEFWRIPMCAIPMTVWQNSVMSKSLINLSDITWRIFFSSSTALWSRNIHTYSFPADCCDFTRRVALSIHTIRHPVTLGSSVPLCPVFSTRSILFIHATTSCDDGFAGLSKLMKPALEKISKI